MPTQLHEVLVEMFRVRPELARELIEECASVEMADGACEAASIDLSQVVPSEYRADAVTVIRDGDTAAAAIVVEVQLAPDPDKIRTWPVYVTALRARLRCPTTLLVIAPDETAGWAQRPIAIGHPGFVLQPIVIAFSQVPRVTEPARAREAPELAVLSVLAHQELDVAAAALTSLDLLPEDLGKLYFDLILNALPRALQQALEAAVLKNYVYQSDFAVRHLRQGRYEGRVEALQQVALELVRVKLGTVEAEQRRKVEDLDVDALFALVTALGSAADKAAVLAVLDALPEP